MIHPLSIAIVGFGRMAQTFYTPGLKRLAPEARYIIVDPVDEARGKAKEILPTAAAWQRSRNWRTRQWMPLS